MPYFLVQASYTPKAWEGFLSKPEDRQATMQRAAEAAGCKIHHLFFSFGKHDAVVLMEGPDQQSVLALLMSTAASGAVSLHTTVLVTAAEAKEAMTKAGKLKGVYRAPGTAG